MVPRNESVRSRSHLPLLSDSDDWQATAHSPSQHLLNANNNDEEAGEGMQGGERNVFISRKTFLSPYNSSGWLDTLSRGLIQCGPRAIRKVWPRRQTGPLKRRGVGRTRIIYIVTNLIEKSGDATKRARKYWNAKKNGNAVRDPHKTPRAAVFHDPLIAGWQIPGQRHTQLTKKDKIQPRAKSTTLSLLIRLHRGE